MSGFVCLVEVRLHVAGSGSLKEKRQVVRSVKETIRSRAGASVAAIEGQQTWQRSTLLCAVVGGSAGEVADRADRIEAIAFERCPEGASFSRRTQSRGPVVSGALQIGFTSSRVPGWL